MTSEQRGSGVRVSVVSSEELLNFFIMAVSKLILSINNDYKLIRLLQNFMVCGVQFVENWGVRSNYSLIGWCMSVFNTLIRSDNFREVRKIIKPSTFLSV